MIELLQRLWDQFCDMSDQLEDVIDDQPLNKEPYKTIENIIDDTSDMVKLRQDLFDAGVQKIAGFKY